VTKKYLNVTDYEEVQRLTKRVLKELLRSARGNVITFCRKRVKGVLKRVPTPITMNLMHYHILRDYRDAVVTTFVYNHSRRILLHRKALECLINNKEVSEEVKEEVRECRREISAPLNKEVVKLAIRELEELGFEVNVPILIDKLREEGYDTTNFYEVLRELVRGGEATVLGSFLNSKKRVAQTAIDDFLVMTS